MWDKHTHEILVNQIPFDVEVSWDKTPSFQKFGYVNTLLMAILTLDQCGGVLVNEQLESINSVKIHNIRRKLTDRKKSTFSIVGHESGKPILLSKLDPILFEIYFNYHLFVEAETTYHQYFPSAAVIIRCRNYLKRKLVPSPGSWGSDIITMTYDWNGTFIIENVVQKMGSTIRKNFRGYKLAPSPYKYLITTKLRSILYKSPD